MLAGHDGLLPARSALLAKFAGLVTARPWALTAELGAEFAAEGFDREAVESAAGVTAMFNYFTRVADASGIEFDYRSPLPQFRPARDRQPVRRPDPREWPMVAGEARLFHAGSPLNEVWRAWREYLIDSPEPLTARQRRVLARAAAQESCDRWQADEFADYAPAGDPELALDAFARRLSRRPWAMGPADLQTLRDAGFPEEALLHAISVVAQQNAESRLAIGLRLTEAIALAGG